MQRRMYYFLTASPVHGGGTICGTFEHLSHEEEPLLRQVVVDPRMANVKQASCEKAHTANCGFVNCRTPSSGYADWCDD